MSRRHHSYNAFAAALANPITAVQSSFDLTTTAGLQAPGRLVLDRSNPLKREWIRYSGISGVTLTGITRGLTGSTSVPGGTDHDAGTEVHTVPMAQDLDDLYSDIEDLEADVASHAAAANPHPGYATDADVATVNAAIAVHTGQISIINTELTALEAVDAQHQLDLDALEAADAGHFGGSEITDHPAATDLTHGFMAPGHYSKIERLGRSIRLGKGNIQAVGGGGTAFVDWDQVTDDPHNWWNGTVITVPYAGFYETRLLVDIDSGGLDAIRFRLNSSTAGSGGSVQPLTDGIASLMSMYTNGAGGSALMRWSAGTTVAVEVVDTADAVVTNIGTQSLFYVVFKGP